MEVEPVRSPLMSGEWLINLLGWMISVGRTSSVSRWCAIDLDKLSKKMTCRRSEDDEFL